MLMSKEREPDRALPRAVECTIVLGSAPPLPPARVGGEAGSS